MRLFCICINALLGLLSIPVLLCGLFPAFQKWLHSKEEAMKNLYPRMSRFIVIALGILLPSYFLSTAWLQYEDVTTQSPIYQRQKTLKYDLRRLASQFKDAANNPSKRLSLWEQRVRIASLFDQAQREGLDAGDAIGIHANKFGGMQMNDPNGATVCLELSSAIEKLSSQLPVKDSSF